MQFRSDIQGLRALAVLFVFVFHLSNTYLPGGFIGVDMFFVISGYLISQIVIYKIQNEKFNLFDFYIGRVKRIVPAYYFLLIVVWILFLFLFASSESLKFRLSHIWTFLFNSNYHFARVDNYFGASSNETPLLHTWTLSVEMQFYFILPILLLLIRNTKKLFITLIILSIALFSYSTHQILLGNKFNMYFSLLARTPEFLLGVLLALCKFESLKITNRKANYISFLGLIILIASVFLFNESSAFPGFMALIPCLGISLILITPSSKLNIFLSNKIFTYLGEISYSIYLWHWPIMAFYRYSINRYEFSNLETLYVILLTIMASLFSYYFVERPFRNSKGLKFYITMIVLVVVNVLMVHYIYKVKSLIKPLPPKLGFPTIGIPSHGEDFSKVDFLGDTAIQNSNVLFLGDSHALTLKSYLDIMGKKNKFNFRTLTSDVYATLPYLSTEEIIENKRFEIYQKYVPFIEREVNNAKVIIILFHGDGEKYCKAIEKLLNSLNGDQKLLLLRDYPRVDKNPIRFNKGFINDKSTKYIIERPIISANILQLVESSSKAKYVDLTNVGDVFENIPFYNDTLMYYDPSHINQYGAEKFAEITEDEFMKYFNWAKN